MWRGTHVNEQLGSGAEPYGALKVQLAYVGRDAANEAFDLGDLIIITCTRSDSSFELFPLPEVRPLEWRCAGETVVGTGSRCGT